MTKSDWRANRHQRGRWRAGLDLAAATVRSIGKRFVECWARSRKKPVLRQMGVDDIYLGKSQKFLTVVSNLETGEPLWFGRERKQETLDEFFRTELSPLRRSRIEAACVDMWGPFTTSILKWAPQCRIVYESFTSCSMPTGLWMKRGGRSSRARAGACGDW